jgi:ABC-type uncharacterized transport system permease subunit
MNIASYYHTLVFALGFGAYASGYSFCGTLVANLRLLIRNLVLGSVDLVGVLESSLSLVWSQSLKIDKRLVS